MSKSKKIFLSIMIVFLLSFANLAAVVKNDSSAFITKPEFDSLKNNVDEKINMYNKNAYSKIDQAIESYLAEYDVEHRKGSTKNKQTRIIINNHSELPVVNRKDYDEDTHYFAKDTGEEYAARRFQDGTYEWKVVDPIGNINIDKTGADENKVPVVNSVGKYEIERAVLEKRIEKDNDLLTVSELTVYDETNNVDKNYEMMTENAMAKVMAKALGVSYTDTGNTLKKTLAYALGLEYNESKTLIQMNYDKNYPIGTTVMQSSAPNVPEGVNASWERITTDKTKYLYIDNGSALEGDTIDATTITDGHILTNSEFPVHKHNISDSSHDHSLDSETHTHSVSGGMAIQHVSAGTATRPLLLQNGASIDSTSTTISATIEDAYTGITTTDDNTGGGGEHTHDLTDLKVDGVVFILWKRTA